MDGWIAVGRSAHICQKPKQLALRGNRYVAWRTPKGQVRFIPDSCKHRGASLSLGTVEPDGCLKCAYHKWRYDDKGYNTFGDDLRIPFMEHKLMRTQEQDGLLWVTTSMGTEPPKATCDDSVWIEHWYEQCAQLVFESWVMNITKSSIIMPYTVRIKPSIMITVCPIDENTSKMFIGFSRKDGVPMWLFDVLNGNREIIKSIDKDFCYKGLVEPAIQDYRQFLSTYEFR